jgi:GNAT superfamily N-acetyltransferase
MKLREAETGDIDVVAGFLLAMVQEMASFGGHAVAEGHHASAWCHNHVVSGLSDPDLVLLLAESEEPPAAPLGIVEASITEPHPVFEAKRILHLHSLYVDPAHRRSGIGLQLLEAALQWGRDRECVEAELNSLVGNPGRHLYESLGFRVFELELRRSL